MAVLLLWIGAREVLVDKAMSGADLIAFLLYALRLLQPLKQLSQMRTTAQSSLASAERLFEILDSPIGGSDGYRDARSGAVRAGDRIPGRDICV